MARKHYFLIKISPRNTIRLGVKVRDAKSPVALSRVMADIMAGTEGLSVTCANAICALRLNGEAFPHPVYMAEFTDNRAYFVDKLDKRGTPISCVRYAHNEGAFQKSYDTKSKSRMAKMSGVEKTFVLSPPPPAGNGMARRGSTSSGTTYAKRQAKKTAFSKGAIARAERAGIQLNPKANAA